MTPSELPADLPVLEGLEVEEVQDGDYRKALVGQNKLVCRRDEGIEAGTAIGMYRWACVAA
jgi:hypothetical protein